jgi:hypothetical protein
MADHALPAVEHRKRMFGRCHQWRIWGHPRHIFLNMEVAAQLLHECSQCLTLSVFTAITGLVMIGVR